MKTVSELKAIVEEIYPEIDDDGVRTFRPFYEGAISFYATKGDRIKAHHNYKRDHFHQADWNLGWSRAKECGQQKLKQEFKFMECVA